MVKASRGEENLANMLDYAGINYKREYRFHPTRRWRFDFAFVEHKIAVEVEGGSFGRVVRCHICGQVVLRRLKSGKMMTVREGGRHNTGAGFRADLEKYNEASLLGWSVLRFTPEQVRSGYAMDTINAMLNHKEITRKVQSEDSLSP